VVQGVDQSGDKAIAIGQVGLDGPSGRLVREGEESPDGSEKRRRRGCHEQHQIDKFGDRDRSSERLPIEAIVENLPGVAWNAAGREARIVVTHWQLPIQAWT